MEFLDILEYDAEHNEENLSLNELLECYLDLQQEGFKEIKLDKTIFLFKIEGKHIDYHTVNAAPKKEYINNLKYFMCALKNRGYKTASTELTNLKLKAFVKRYFSHNTIIEDDKAITFLDVEIENG